jgi:3-hydroxyacyl-CoA dehydrogenase
VSDTAAVEAAGKQAARRTPRQVAPLKAIELVDAASRLPLAEGLALERETFLALKSSDEAAALRHVFFAERASMSQSRGAGAEVASAVVVGGGTMGAGIAYALAGIGVKVALVENDAAGVDRAKANVGKLYGEAVARGKATAERAAAEQAGRFTFHAGYDALPPADIAIEAVFEDLDVKRSVFAALDAALPATAILATNTSYLDVNRIADVVRNPERFLGLHFFSPAHLMKLLEVVKGRETSPDTLATALRLGARLKKIPVLAGVCDGFIGNRILTRYRQTCDVMLIEGALPGQVDAALRGFGMAMGPYEVQDLSGLDIAYANRKRLGWRTKANFRYVPIADRIVEQTGRLGRKTGAGWYDHGEKPAPSPVIEAIVVEESARAGIRRRPFDDAEIVARATTAMIEEGARILEEGIAAKPSDIDLVMIHGYAFPRWRGGPMHYAERTGLADILARIESYAATDPLSWAVPDLLRRAVDTGRGLDDLVR